MDIEHTPIFKKVTFFFDRYIETLFPAEDILWVFSLSGGKDSFSMFQAIAHWYAVHKKKFTYRNIHIRQWGMGEPDTLALQYAEILDYTQETLLLNKKARVQAPCRECANIRRLATDGFIESLSHPGPVFIARGLHLTDTAVSFAWRHFFGIPPLLDSQKNNKYQPITRLKNNIYLAKPLCFTREYETSSYAGNLRLQFSTCACPAPEAPPRRDIIKELLPSLPHKIWELEIEDIENYIAHWGGEDAVEFVTLTSFIGTEPRPCILSEPFIEFCMDHFLKKATRKPKGTQPSTTQQFRDNIIFNLTKNSNTLDEKRKFITLGPLYEDYAKCDHKKITALAIQREILSLNITDKLQHIAILLKKFMESKKC